MNVGAQVKKSLHAIDWPDEPNVEQVRAAAVKRTVYQEAGGPARG